MILPPITIRQATAADNILLATLGRETFAQAFAAQNTPENMAAYLAAMFNPDLQAAELADPQNIFWLVYAGATVVGYVKLFTGKPAPCVSNRQALKISRLYLSQPYWKQGIGQQVLSQVISFAKQQGFSVVWLTVWEHNPGAIKLYTRFGFKPVGEEDFILGQDVQRDYIMEKVL